MRISLFVFTATGVIAVTALDVQSLRAQALVAQPVAFEVASPRPISSASSYPQNRNPSIGKPPAVTLRPEQAWLV
jgi:hypothetical protein